MELRAGQKLLHYRLVDPIGEGGMGVVWRAVDTSLDREAALKFLPPGMADPGRLARFEREARLLGSLSHPNIAAVYALHRQDGDSPPAPFLAMELVPGEDLAARIARGPVPHDDAIEIAARIAEGLEAAHEAGVVHRDLKPANVRMAPDGRVKVLDFGLAKALSPDPETSGNDLSQSPTMTSVGSVAGIILGTAAYMSPEQARGKHVDRRTDIWAFGCVLHEMLTGKKVFEGETATDVIAAIVTREPDWDALPESTPPTVRRLLRRCLDKRPRTRLRDIGEARILLQESDDGMSTTTPAVSRPAPRRPLAVWIAVVATALAASAVTWWLAGPVTKKEVRRYHLSLMTDERAPFTVGDRFSNFDLHPDGSSLIYTAIPPGGKRGLYLQPLDGSRGGRIEGSDGGYQPRFSSDGKWIAFLVGGKLRKIPASGGSAVSVAETATSAAGLHWGTDGFVYHSPSYVDDIYRVPATGGTVERLTSRDTERGDFAHWWPTAVPGGRFLLYSRWRTRLENCSVWVLDLETREDRLLLDDACWTALTPEHLLFGRRGKVMGVRFDQDRAVTTGTPGVVLDDAYVDASSGNVNLRLSPDGTLAYLKDQYGGNRSNLVWVDMNGAMATLTPELQDYGRIRISPDGNLVALVIRDGVGNDLWLHDLDRGAARRFTFDGTNFSPCWSLDGRSLLFGSSRAGPFDLYQKPVDESEPVSPYLSTEFDKNALGWSRDGKILLYEVDARETSEDVWAYESGEARPILQGEHDEENASFSPVGDWLTYQSDHSGRDEVYVETFPTGGGRWQVSVEGGQYPLWHPDGSAIFYYHEESVYVVDIDTEDGFRAGRPRRIFGKKELRSTIDAYDLHPDGDRFIMARSDPDESAPIEIRLGWFDELKSLVP